MGLTTLMAGIVTGVNAREKTNETEKSGFFRQAFRDMKESAKKSGSPQECTGEGISAADG